jgi:hypothetical protein
MFISGVFTLCLLSSSKEQELEKNASPYLLSFKMTEKSWPYLFIFLFSGFRIVPADGGRFQSKKLRNKTKGKESKKNTFYILYFYLNNSKYYIFSS